MAKTEEKSVVEQTHYIVILDDNRMTNVLKCTGLDTAVELANEKLKTRLCRMGFPKAYDDDLEGSMFDRCSSRTGYNAWIRHKDVRWDAYVYSEERMKLLVTNLT